MLRTSGDIFGAVDPTGQESKTGSATSLPVARKVTNKPRRSRFRDTNSHKKISRITARKGKASDRGSLEGNTTPLLSPFQEAFLTELALGRAADDHRAPPSWERTTEIIKAIYAHRAVSETGGHTFSLNLGPDVIAAAEADAKGFADYVRRRLDRCLKRKFGRNVDLWFVVEITDKGRPHLHGGLTINANEIDAATKALAKAGGKWANEHRAERQVDIGVRTDDEWPLYACGTLSSTGKKISGSLLAKSRELTRRARQLYEADRNLISQR